MYFAYSDDTVAFLKRKNTRVLSKSQQTKMLCLSIGVETSFFPWILVKRGVFSLQVDWDCFLSYGDFGIFCHMVRSGSWSVSWAEPCADLRPWETLSKSCAQLWDWAPRGDWPQWRAAMAFAKVLCVGCQRHPLSPRPSHLLALSREEGIEDEGGDSSPWHELDLDIGPLSTETT